MLSPDVAGNRLPPSPLTARPPIQIQTKNDTCYSYDKVHAGNAAQIPVSPRSNSRSISDFYICFKTLFSYNGTALHRTATLSSPPLSRPP